MSTKSLASVIGGKTARACDSCVKRRARWYCTADDAFLCHACDKSVHSANPISRRHEKVRLKTASSGKHHHVSDHFSLPHQATWDQGFTRKARTPRGGKKRSNTMVLHDVVPEMSAEDQRERYDGEEQLIFEVPVMNSMAEEQCFNESMERKIQIPMMSECFKNSDKEDDDNVESCLNGLFPTDMDLAQFTADVETLLGGGAEQDFHPKEELGLGIGETFKIEKEEIEEDKGVATKEVYDVDENNETSPFEISFDYEYTYKEDDKEEVRKNEMDKMVKEEKQEKALMLRLDYNSIISTWKGQEIPWTTQELSKIDLDLVCHPTDTMDDQSEPEAHHQNGLGLHMVDVDDKGREAKVTRYREKRRTRLFSKKIRYEVRKLNAEKRPRLKGRFVKRS